MKKFKKMILAQDVPEIDFGNISKSPRLGVFDFRAFLNLAMLIVESQRARLLRTTIPYLENIQNDDYYPNFADKLTHLFFSTCKFHSFLDGNKRLAITLSAQFLLLNGYLYCTSQFIREMENISYHVADNSKVETLMNKEIKIIVEKHSDGYIAYPLGLKGVFIGEGDTYEGALHHIKSAIEFHIETFGNKVIKKVIK